MMNTENNANPELGRRIKAHGIDTNYHDVGQAREGSKPLLMIHGSGPGVSAWANWRLNMPVLAEQRRVIAPDMVGFGFTERPPGKVWSMDTWVAHAVGVLDALDIAQADLLGNSFGGALALALAIRHPERVGKLILANGFVDFAQQHVLLGRGAIGGLLGTVQAVVGWESQAGAFFRLRWQMRAV